MWERCEGGECKEGVGGEEGGVGGEEWGDGTQGESSREVGVAQRREESHTEIKTPCNIRSFSRGNIYQTAYASLSHGGRM